MAETRTYKGSCHCGAVHYQVTTDLGNLMDCNCSRCKRLGWIMQPVPGEQFVLEGGADNLSPYRFNTDRIDHSFCSTCGIESFARGQDQDGKETVMINVNCLEDAPAIDRANIYHWDGASA
jgi:hypothetical protein